jgi:hypothetical protein
MSFAEKNASDAAQFQTPLYCTFTTDLCQRPLQIRNDHPMDVHAAGHKTFTQSWEYILADVGLAGAGP